MARVGSAMIHVSVEPDRLVAGQEARLVLIFVNTGDSACTNVVFKVDLPPGFLLLGGRNLVEIARILPGRQHAHELIVEPRQPGQFAIASTNFSYRDEFDVACRVTDSRVPVSVRAAGPVAAPPEILGIACSGSELVLGEWGVLKVSVRNLTPAPVSDITVTVMDGEVRTDAPGTAIPVLDGGDVTRLSFPVLASVGGRHVPVTIRTSYQVPAPSGPARRRAQADRFQLAVRPAQEPAAPAAGVGTPPQTILYLTAGPVDLEMLRSNEELRNVKERLQLGRYRGRFRLEPYLAVRLADIGQALADHEPRIVHFSGHGDRSGAIYVEDVTGYSEPVTPDGLGALFGEYAHSIGCVIVNACHSMRLAEAMAEHIDHVVAMRSEIGDEAAIVFSVGFYQGLFAGRPVPEAFRLGCALLRAKQTARPEYRTPVLLGRHHR